jgi:mevalonate kinase
MDKPCAWRLVIHSTIPIASGLGSGAAVSAAIVRALASASGKELAPADVSELVYQVDRLHHGNPSGIDNTVIAFEEPVYYVRGQSPQRFSIGRPFRLVIADTGVRSPTRITVGDVRRRWEHDPAPLEACFDRIGALVEAAREAIASGHTSRIGPLMDENQEMLRQLGVSSPELEMLASEARRAGAMGAKLSGGGRGGNLIALVTPETAGNVADRLREAGAAGVIVTPVGSPSGES